MDIRLLLVDQGEQHAKEYIVHRLAKLGYRVTLLQWSSAVWSPELFERVLVARLTNWQFLADTLRAEHARDPFAGVLCYNEGALLAADDIARMLGLPRLSRFDAESFRHKDRMRVAWEANGLPVPRYRVLYGPADARVLRTWRFPVVLKPTAVMGSKGVLRLDSYDDVLRELPAVLRTDMEIPLGGELWTLSEAFNLPSVALAEEYVAGPEYSAEGVVVGGSYQLIGLTEKVLTAEPYFDEVGHVFPTDAVGPARLASLTELLQRAHTALGMANAITHTEFRMPGGRPVLIELNARIAGGYIPALVDEVTGLDTVDLAARSACGSLALPATGLSGAAERPRAAAVAFLTCPAPAYRKRLVKAARPPLPPGCEELSASWYVAPGEVIPAPCGSGATRLGHVIFRAPEPAVAREALAAVRAGLDVAYAEP